MSNAEALMLRDENEAATSVAGSQGEFIPVLAFLKF
jgi:hypothetical protein